VHGNDSIYLVSWVAGRRKWSVNLAGQVSVALMIVCRIFRGPNRDFRGAPGVSSWMVTLA
jgi:hypothetical protein